MLVPGEKWNHYVRRQAKKLLPLSILLPVFAGVFFAYSPSLQAYWYRADDYLLLSVGMRHGLAKSLFIPFKDHFVPLLRLLMTGFYAQFHSAVPMQILNIIFHTINIVLIFQIVLHRTRSHVISGIAAVTFGISYPAASCVLVSINGIWVMSLTFLLLMIIFLDKFLEADHVSKTTSGDSRGEPEFLLTEGSLRYYYVGLIFFIIALCFYTTPLFGGFLWWAFMCFEVLRKKDIRRNPQYYLRVGAPLILIVFSYLGLRLYLNKQYFSSQDLLFRVASNLPAYTFPQKVDLVKALPSGFYEDFIQRLTPYFPDHYVLVFSVIFLLMAYKLISEAGEAKIVLKWLLFAGFLAAIPVFGRLFFIIRLTGSSRFAMQWWYFYYSAAGIAIALGILLKPPSLLNGIINKFSTITRVSVVCFILVIVAYCNVGKAKEIRSEALRMGKEDRNFHLLLEQYEKSMRNFLRSSSYSTQQKLLLMNLPAANVAVYPAAWSVMQENIFYLYFPEVHNVIFVNEQPPNDDLYLWTPTAVIQSTLVRK